MAKDEGGGSWIKRLGTGPFETAYEFLTGASQTEAIKEATRLQTELAQEQLKWQKELAAEGKTEREIFRNIRQRSAQFIESNINKVQDTEQRNAIERLINIDPATPGRRLIEQDLMREPGTSPLFQTALRRGTEALARQMAPLGLVSGPGGSTAFGRATGELTEGLLANEIESVRAGRYRLEGLQARDREAGWGRRFALEGLQTRDREADWGRRYSLAGLGPPSTTAGAATNAYGQYAGTMANIANLGLAGGQLAQDRATNVMSFGGSIGQQLLKGYFKDKITGGLSKNGTTEGAPDYGY